MLKDLKRYEKPIGGGRIFSQYLHERLGLEYQTLEINTYPVLNNEYAHKLGLSWNMGLSDFRDWKKSFLFRNTLNSLPKDKKSFDEKRLDTYFNGTVNDSITGWQRKRCQELLLARKDINWAQMKTSVGA